MSGLNLVRGERAIDVPAVITEARAGVSSGELARMVQSPRRVDWNPIESSDETAANDPGGRSVRYDLADLEDGVYRALSVGRDARQTTTYFIVAGGEVQRELGSDLNRATREAKRLGGKAGW